MTDESGGYLVGPQEIKIAEKEWLKKWGGFTDEEVEKYPWCLVDVMTIMGEYRMRGDDRIMELEQEIVLLKQGRTND